MFFPILKLTSILTSIVEIINTLTTEKVIFKTADVTVSAGKSKRTLPIFRVI